MGASSLNEFLGFPVRDVMTVSIVALEDSLPVLEAVRIIREKRISGAPVKNANGKYIGVISKTDFIDQDLFGQDRKVLETVYLRDVVKPVSILTIHQDKRVEEAAEMMLNHHFHRIFVSDDENQIVGVLSSYDVMKVVATYADLKALQDKHQLEVEPFTMLSTSQ